LERKQGAIMPTFPTALLRWTTTDAVVDDERTLHSDGGLALRPDVSETTFTFPPQTAPQPFAEAVASWQGVAPAQTEMEVALRVMIGERWTRWWTMGIWSAEQTRRRSVEDQRDDDGHVSTDTLKLRQPATAVQCRVTLRSTHPDQTPVLRSIAVMTTPATRAPMVDLPSPVAPLDVPSISQMELEGGEVWCSPVALTMVLQYWQARLDDPRLAPFLAPEASAQLTVPGVYDPVYEGTGNWPFNTAFASSLGLQAYVARFDTLADIVPWLEAGIPVIASISWEPGQLDNAPVAHSGGHLVVVVGFTTCGDVIVNDPAGLTSADIPVRRTYRRDQFKQAWQRKGYGTVYLIYPPGVE
jgi:hypothetical protein